MAGANDISGLKMDPKTTLKASDIHIREFSFTGKSTSTVHDDILEQVSRSARQAAQAQPQTKNSIKMSAVDIDFSSLRADLGDEGPEGAALREAKRLINQQQYEQAIDKLNAVFEIDPHHHEAWYLKAFCQHETNRLKGALESLSQLADAALSNRLQTRVQSLKEDIRAQTLPQAMKVYADGVKSRQVGKSIKILQQHADADPEVGKFHYYLAGVLVVGKQLEQARTAAVHGLDICRTDRDELQQLFREIEKRFLPRTLGPARKLFRAKQYTEAGAELESLAADVQQTSLWKSFSGYMDQLTGQGKKGLFSRLISGSIKTHDPPPGTPAEVRELFEYLLEPEMKAARLAVEKPDYTAAERALTSAVAMAPAFTVANHMLATCVYQRVGATVKTKIGKDLDDAGSKQLQHCKSQLDEARSYAANCLKDPEIPDAKLLLDSIDQMRKDIADVVERHESQAHDAKLVNKAIDEFIGLLVNIMMLNNSKDQWEIRRLANELYNQLSRLRNELPALKRQCKGAQAKEIMDLVRTRFVEPNYNLLRKVINR